MLSKNKALKVLGLSKSAAHYRRHPRPAVTAPIAHRDRVHPARLTEQETTTIVQLLKNSSTSIDRTFYSHLDRGRYIASLSTWHRIARAHNITMAVTGSRRTKRTPHTGASDQRRAVTATRPGEVLCWDISYLPGPDRRTWYALYLVIDLFSRKIMGFTIQPGENKHDARDLIASILDATKGATTTVHSDNGAAMTSHLMKKLLKERAVTLSTIRPSVSNDNAHMESVFRTIKYGPTWPGIFESITDAEVWMTTFVTAYNSYPHTRLAGFTPASVYDGTWHDQARTRQATLDASYAHHSERYRQPPRILTPTATVVLPLGHNDGKTHTPPTLIELVGA